MGGQQHQSPDILIKETGHMKILQKMYCLVPSQGLTNIWIYKYILFLLDVLIDNSFHFRSYLWPFTRKYFYRNFLALNITNIFKHSIVQGELANTFILIALHCMF